MAVGKERSLTERLNFYSVSRIALVVLVSLTVLYDCYFAIYPFPLIGHDSAAHLNWIEQFITLQKEGVFYPRWLPLSFGGFGAPVFYFYPPLVYFLGGLIRVVVGDNSPMNFLHVVELGSSLFSIVALYWYFRLVKIERWVALLAAATYAMPMYRFLNVYIRTALGEQVALAWVPLLFIGVEYAIKDKPKLGAAILGIGWGLLILTNIPVATMSAIAALIYTIVRCRGRFWKTAIQLSFGVIGGSLLAAWFLLPLLGGLQYVKSDNIYDWHRYSSAWAFALREVIYRPSIGAVYAVSILTLGSGAVLLFLMARRRANPSWVSAWLVIGAVAVFLQLPIISKPLWDYVPILHAIQLSYRWCGILLLIPAVAITQIWRERKANYAIFAVMIGMLGLTVAWYVIFHRDMLRYGWNTNVVLPARLDSPEHIPIFIPMSEIAVDSFSVKNINAPAAQIVGDSSSHDYIQLLSSHGNIRTFNIAFSTPHRVQFHSWYWPFFRVTSDQGMIRTFPDSLGILDADLAAGNYKAQLSLRSMSFQPIGGVLTLVGCFIILLLLIADRIPFSVNSKSGKLQNILPPISGKLVDND